MLITDRDETGNKENLKTNSSTEDRLSASVKWARGGSRNPKLRRTSSAAAKPTPTTNVRDMAERHEYASFTNLTAVVTTTGYHNQKFTYAEPVHFCSWSTDSSKKSGYRTRTTHAGLTMVLAASIARKSSNDDTTCSQGIPTAPNHSESRKAQK